MRRWLTLGIALSLSACATQTLPPALPEEPVIIDALQTTPEVPLVECPSAATVPYPRQRIPPPDGEPIALREPVAPRPPKAKPLDVDKLIGQANKAAQITPTEHGYFGGRAVYRYTYVPGKVYVIYTNPQQFTKLYFPPGEKAATLPTLNDEQWKTITARIGPSGRAQDVLGVRPVEDNLSTDVAIEMESGRSYFLHLQPSKHPMLGVTWELPRMGELVEGGGDESTDIQGVSASRTACAAAGATHGMLMPIDLATLHTGYKIEVKGAPGFVPTQVFDDGRKTVIKMKNLTGNAPVVFTFKPDGSRGLVQFAPYAVPGDPQRSVYYLVENIWPRIILAGTDGAEVLITRLSEGVAVAQPWQRP